MLGGELAVLQAPMFDGLSLDPFSLFDDVAGPAEVGVMVLSHFCSGLSAHLGGLSFESQGAFSTQR